MADAVVIRTEKAGLANLGAPDLEEQFQDHMARIAEVFGEASDKETGNPFGSDIVGAKITVVYTFKCNAKNGAVEVTSSAKVSLPNRRSVSSSLMLRGGRLLIEEDTQEPLQFTKQGS